MGGESHAQDTVHFGGHGWSQEWMKAKSVQSAVTEGGAVVLPSGDQAGRGTRRDTHPTTV